MALREADVLTELLAFTGDVANTHIIVVLLY